MPYNSIHSGENVDLAVGSNLKYYDTGASDTNGRWTVTIPGITALTDGLIIHVHLSKSYNGTYNTLNVNGLGEKLCWYRKNERLTSHLPQYAEATFVYRSDAGTYSSFTGGWVLEYQYQDGNTYDRKILGSQVLTAGTNGIYGTQLVMQDGNGKWQSICKNSTTAASSTLNTVGFRPEVIYYYGSSTTISNGNNTGTWTVYSAIPMDARYSINATSLTNTKPLYLVGTFNSTDGLFYLDTTTWWAQDLPTTNNNKAYVYVGTAYSTTNIYLAETHPIYMYDSKLGKYVSRPSSNLTAADVGALATGTTLDSIADGSTRKLANYLPLSGGTLTGNLNLKANQYNREGALNCNNSDIMGVNSIYTVDLADNTAEGLRFYRDSTHWDSLTMSGGEIYFMPNDVAAGTAFSSANKVLHTGKLTNATLNTAAATKSTSTNGGLYAVELDKNGQLAVRVPWTDSQGVTKVTAGYGLNTTSGDTTTDGGNITSTGTLYLTKVNSNVGSFGPSSDASPAHSGTFSVPYITVDKAGRVTAASTKTITLPASGNTHNSHKINSGKKSDGTTDIMSASASSGDITLGDSGVTAGSYGNSDNQTPSYGSTFNVPYITVNAKGIVTAVSNKTVKIPASDNTNTWRAIKVAGTEKLANNSSTALDFRNSAIPGYESGVVHFEWDSTNNAILAGVDLSGYQPSDYALSAISSATEPVAGETKYLQFTYPSSAPGYSASFISQFPIAAIPTGTTSTTVALGNHTHSNYLTADDLAGFVTSDVTGVLSTNYLTMFKTGTAPENPGLHVTKKGLAYAETASSGASITAEGKTQFNLIAGTYGGVTINIPTSTSLAFIPMTAMIGANATKDLGSSTNLWTNLYLSGNLSDGTNSKSIASLVTGPATNTNNAISLWDGADSKTLKDSSLKYNKDANNNVTIYNSALGALYLEGGTMIGAGKGLRVYSNTSGQQVTPECAYTSGSDPTKSFLGTSTYPWYTADIASNVNIGNSDSSVGGSLSIVNNYGVAILSKVSSSASIQLSHAGTSTYTLTFPTTTGTLLTDADLASVSSGILMSNGTTIYSQAFSATANRALVCTTANSAPTWTTVNSAISLSSSSTMSYLIGASSTSSAANLYAYSSCYMTGGNIYATSFYASSDARLKENITSPKLSYLDILNNINIREFSWKADAEHNLNLGVIAQELKDAIPNKYYKEFISEPATDETYMSINESKFVYLVIGALKEQQKEIETLKEKLNTLNKS